MAEFHFICHMFRKELLGVTGIILGQNSHDIDLMCFVT